MVQEAHFAVQDTMVVEKEGKLKIIFAVKDKAGTLADALKVFRDYDVNLEHIESRPSKRFPKHHEFLLELCEVPKDANTMITALKEVVEDVIVQSDEPAKHEGAIPWFPTKIRHLDEFANRVLSYGSELDSDHPGFTDPVYRARRKEFADIAHEYRHGQPIPRVSYTDEEITTWRTVFKSLTELYPTHACKEFNYAFPFLRENCSYNEDTIPQLQDISEFLHDCTGFRLRPVAGLLSSRDFLAGLAFRVFHSTQYIRHPSVPMYTPEPDVCHEILGHVPLFADPDFAEFSQEIGLASLGAPDDWIFKLATLYWFTVEFGLCRQEGKVKAFGAGLLSSFGELQYCLTNEPQVLPFDPAVTSETEYPITKFQPTYFVANSFHDAKEKLSQWTKQIHRPYGVRYNPYTQSVEILDNKQSVMNVMNRVKSDFSTLEDALTKFKL